MSFRAMRIRVENRVNNLRVYIRIVYLQYLYFYIFFKLIDIN